MWTKFSIQVFFSYGHGPEIVHFNVSCQVEVFALLHTTVSVKHCLDSHQDLGNIFGGLIISTVKENSV